METNRIEYKRELSEGLEKEVVAFLNYGDGGVVDSIGRIKSLRRDLSFEQLRIYYEEAGFQPGDKFAANLELLTEDGFYNYAAYLLADNNGNSVQVAKYRGLDRFELVKSHEYGYCSIIKSCKNVLDRLDMENRTMVRITHKERITRRYWNAVALREAVINAIIHNDYTNEAVPKFEIFDDRLEITSAGSIPPGVVEKEFFSGYSNPRNKILMRIFRDLGMVEYLGSGMPRILQAYPKESYIFTPNFIRTVFPISEEALLMEQGEEPPEEILPNKKAKELSEEILPNKKAKELSEEILPSKSAEASYNEADDGLVIHRKLPDKTLDSTHETCKNYPINRKSLPNKFNDTTQKILDLLMNNPKMCRKEIAAELGDITEDGVKYQLAKLKKQGRIRRVGSFKSGHWEII